MKLFMMRVSLVWSIIVVLFIMGGVGIWVFNTYPMKAADIHSSIITTPIAVPGGMIEVETRYTKYRSTPGLAIKEAIAVSSSGLSYLLFSDVTNVPVGINQRSTRLLHIPDNMLPGVYWLDNTWQWPLPGWREPQLISRRSVNTFTVVSLRKVK
jgi:hypothetical protein